MFRSPRFPRLGSSLSVAALVALSGCGKKEELDPALESREAILRRQVEGGESLLAKARAGPIVSFDELLFTLDEKLVRELLGSAMPYERVVDDRYRVRIESADVRFSTGFALVELGGRATLADRDEETAFADLRVQGALTVTGLDARTGVLQARVEVIGFEVPQAGVLGLSGPVRRLVEDLARESVQDFNELNSELEIPVSVESELEMPAIEDDDVWIAAARIPLRVAVRDVEVAARKLWVAVGVEVLRADSSSAVPPEAGAPASPVLLVRSAPPAPPSNPVRTESLAASRRTPARVLRLPGLARAIAQEVEPRGADTRPDIDDPARPDSLDTPAMQAMRQRFAVLRDSVLALAARDSLLLTLAADSGDVVLGIRPALVNRLLAEASAAYLDTVNLRLELEDEDIQEVEDVEVDTPLGDVVVGSYRVDVTIHEVQGVLAAGTPSVSFTDESRLRIVMPARIVSGHGRATLRFAWDGEGIGGLGCDDFQTGLEVTGSVVPRGYEVVGAFHVAADGDDITVRPEFEKQKVRIAVAPSRETWAAVSRKLEAIEDFEECSIAMEFFSPRKIRRELERLVAKGFKVKVPTKLIPVLDLPAGIEEDVEVEDREIRIVAHPNALRMTPDALWYSARVDAALRSTEESARR